MPRLDYPGGTGLRAIMSRVLAIADVHVDYYDNKKLLQSWKPNTYSNDTLVLAGDVTDSIPLLQETLSRLTTVFNKVFFVPGNHELWVKDNETCKNSIQKFHQILRLCESLGVSTHPEKVTTGKAQDEYVWLVPLFSWYATPDDDVTDTLYLSHPSVKEDLQKVNLLWMDYHNCTWPGLYDSYPAAYFCELNEEVISKSYDAPVISFSHFMPRRDLIIPTEAEEAAVRKEREKMGLSGKSPPNQGAPSFFNFSRFAGCRTLEKQIRKLKSCVHFHGHQHRNRDRVIDGIRYIAHSMGNKKERDQGLIWGYADWNGPKQIWPPSDLLS